MIPLFSKALVVSIEECVSRKLYGQVRGFEFINQLASNSRTTELDSSKETSDRELIKNFIREVKVNRYVLIIHNIYLKSPLTISLWSEEEPDTRES